MKYITVFIGIFFLYSLSLSAQDSAINGLEEEAPMLPQVQTEAENNVADTIEPAEQREFDVFRPTEDISEDLAVPFPVDI